MYKVHKFMALNNAQVQYFIEQVGLSATSFGVTEDDAKAVGSSLNKAFGYKCAPAAEIIPGQGKQLQSICIADDCPSAPSADCSGYATVVQPQKAGNSSSSSMPSGSASTSASMPSGSAPASSGSAPAPATSSKTSGAGMLSAGGAAAFIGAAAVLAL